MLKPFFMWAGGKSRMIKRYPREWFEGEFSQYVEPFLGGGAVFAWMWSEGLLPQEVILSDANRELIDLYRTVRDDCDGFIDNISSSFDEYLKLPDKATRKDWYYKRRKQYWQDPTPDKLFVLMRTSFNGVWQTCEDSHGLFGTPSGLLNHSKMSQLYRLDNIAEWREALKCADIMSIDYTYSLGLVGTSSLVYLDPPYRGSFTSYGMDNGDGFQNDVCEQALACANRGNRVLLANRSCDDDFFRDRLADAHIMDFDVTYTAGRRKKTDSGFEAKKAHEFLALMEGGEAIVG